MYWIKKYAWIAIVALAGLWMWAGVDEKEEDAFASQFSLEELETDMVGNSSGENNAQEKIVVDVKGEVARPGVYEMTGESRVADALEKAGGMTEEADVTSVNLAQRLYDEMMIVVHSRIENTNESGYINQTDKIRINYAEVDEIQQLDGIGESKAKAIVQYREDNGMYRTVDDLLDVSGIGEKTLESIRDDIQIP